MFAFPAAIRIYVAVQPVDMRKSFNGLPISARCSGATASNDQPGRSDTRYQWGYLHEAMEVDGANALELLFTPCIDQDVHAVFLRQIGQTDPQALHVIIQDQAGFHLPGADQRVPTNVRLLPLPPYGPELNPVEKLGDLVKDQICNRLYPNLRKLEDRILAALQPWRTTAAHVAALIGDGWLPDGANSGAPA